MTIHPPQEQWENVNTPDTETCSGDHITPHELNMCDDCAKIK